MIILVPISYTSPTMLSVCSQLLLSPQFHISDLRGKIIQNVKFSPIIQNSDSSSKLNPTSQHEPRGMLDFQNRAMDIKLLKFHANQENYTYLEKYDF